MSSVIDVGPNASPEELAKAISQAIAVVQAGGLVVIPTDTSYAVIADAFHVEAITKLREAKTQPETIALPVAAGSLATIAGVANLSPLAVDLANAFWPGPLTILTNAQISLSWKIGPSDNALAIRIPNQTVALAVLRGIGPTVMTGAQQFSQAPIMDIQSAQESLGDAVEMYLDAGPCETPNSTIVDASGEHLRLVRAGKLSLAQLREVLPMMIDATTRIS